MKRFLFSLSLIVAMSLSLLLLALSAQTAQAAPGGPASPGALPSASAANGHLAYITLSGSNQVAMVDTNTYTVTGSIDVGAAGCTHPWQAVMSPDGSAVVVSCYNSGSLVVIETVSHTVVATVNGLSSPDGLAFTPDGSHVLVGSRWSSQVNVVNTASFSVTHTIFTPAYARSVAVHPYLDLAYVTNSNGDIQIIDTTTFAIVASITVGGDPVDVAVSPDGQWVFAGDRWGQGLAVIDATSQSLYTTLTGLGALTGLVVSPDGSTLYAAGLGNGVHVIDTATFSHTATIGGLGNAWELAVTCGGGHVLVGNTGNQAPVIDTVTLSVTHQVALPGSGARGIAVCPPARLPSLSLAPKSQSGYAAPGQAVTYQMRLVNATGQADSFTLGLLPGATWTSTLSITSTDPLADGEGVTFTVQVDIPLSAVPGDSDAVSLQATSVASPTVYSAMANLHTLATGDEIAYVTLADSDRVALVDPASHTAVGSINLSVAGCDYPWQAEMSPDGSYVYVSCLYSYNVVVIETMNHTIVTVIGDIYDPSGIAFTRDGSHALVGMGYNGLAVIDTASFSAILTIPTPDDTRRIAIHPYLDLAYVTSGNTIQVIDTTSFAIVASIALSNSAYDVAVSPDGQWVFVSQGWSGLTVLNAIDYTTYTTVLGGVAGLLGLAALPDGSAIYVGSEQNGVYVIDAATFSHTATIGGIDYAYDLATTCDGSQVFVGNAGNQAPVIDTASLSLTHRVAMPGNGVRGIAICPPARLPGLSLTPQRQTSYAEPGHSVAYQMRLVNATGQADSFTLGLLPGGVWTSTLSITSTGPLADGEGVTFTVQVDIPSSTTPGDSDTISLQAASVASPTVYSATANLHTLATGGELAYATLSNNNIVVVVDAASQTVIRNIDVNTVGCGYPHQAEMSPDGSAVYVSCRYSGNVVVIETLHDTIAAVIGGLYEADGIAFTRDGAYALVANYNQIAVVDTTSLSVVQTVYTPGPVTRVIVHPHLDLAYVTGSSEMLQVIDTTNFSVVASVNLHRGSADNVAVSPDGQWVFVSHSWAGLTVVDAASYTIYTTLTGLGNVLSAAASPDGSAVYVGTVGNGVQVFDAATFSPMAVITATGDAWELAFNCDGSRLYVGNFSDQLPIIDTSLYSVTRQVILPGNGTAGIAVCAASRRPGLVLSPKAQVDYAMPGQTVTHQMRLFNFSGQADSFTLELLPGAAWTSTLSTASTGLLADGQVFTFTVQVDIPPSAAPGDGDSVSLQATSVASPTVYSATANLHTLATGDEIAYITLSDSNQVALVDVVNHATVGSIDVGAAGCNYPWQAEMSPDGGYVYVSCQSSSNVAVIETTNHTVTAVISNLYNAGGIAFTRDGAYALVSTNYNGIAVVDTAIFSVVHTIPTSSYVSKIATHPHLDLAYATSGDILQVIDTTSFAIVTSITLSGYANDVAVSPNGQWVFVSLGWSGLAVIDATGNTIYTTVTGADYLTGLAVAPDGSAIYVDSNEGRVYVIDAVTFSSIATISTGASGVYELATTCDGGQLFVGNGSDQAPVIDTALYSVIYHVALPSSGAHGIAICPQARLPGLPLVPQNQTGYAKPGQSVTYQMRLFNFTGQTDSFTLDLLPGYAWTSTLSINSTGPIANGEGITFTVQVDVPAAALPGDSDSVNLRATSVASPTVYSATADIHTSVTGDTIYVTLSGSDRVAMIDAVTHAVLGDIDVGAAGCYYPWQAAMSPDGSAVYVSCYNSGNLAVIETAGNSVAATVSGLSNPDGIAFTPNGGYALVGSRWSSQVSVIDTTSYSVTHTITTPGNARSVAVHPYLNWAYVTSSDSSIQVIDIATFAIIASIAVNGEPWDVAVSPDGQWVVTGDRGGMGLAIIDAAHNTLYTNVPNMGNLTGLEFAPDGSRLYAISLGNGIQVVDMTAMTHTTTIGVAGSAWELAVSCDGGQVFVGNTSNQLPIMDTVTYSVTDQVTLPGNGARGIAACPQHHTIAQTVTQTGVTPGVWYDFAPTCARLYFTDTGSLQPITVSVTLRHAFPTANRDGLPRRYDITGSSSGFQAMLAACYQDFDLSAAGIPISDEVNLHLYQYAGSPDWSEFSSVDPVHNLITATGVTSFGVWGLGVPGDHPTAVSLQRAQAAVKAHSGWLAALLGVGLAGAWWVRRRRARR